MGDHDADPLDTVAKRKFDAKIAANLKTLAPLGSKLARLVVPVSSQEPYLLYELPRRAFATNRIDLVTAPGEHEAASLLCREDAVDGQGRESHAAYRVFVRRLARQALVPHGRRVGEHYPTAASVC